MSAPERLFFVASVLAKIAGEFAGAFVLGGIFVGACLLHRSFRGRAVRGSDKWRKRG